MSDERGWFDRPVSVRGIRAGQSIEVSNATQAADMLLNRWPTITGNGHIEARRAVLKALESHSDAKARAKARDAFRAAAAEAGILRE